jgi:hypothetical protein
MFSRLLSANDVAFLLDRDINVLQDEVLTTGDLKPARKGPKGARYRVGDVVVYQLAQVIQHTGVEAPKAITYAETILESRLATHDSHVMEWVENETQELFCLIADHQLCRVFLRNKDDFREIDVAAVKPVLLPSTICELNVFRVIRPVLYRAHQLLRPK